LEVYQVHPSIVKLYVSKIEELPTIVGLIFKGLRSIPDLDFLLAKSTALDRVLTLRELEKDG
jgi:hypothetical protein